MKSLRASIFAKLLFVAALVGSLTLGADASNVGTVSLSAVGNSNAITIRVAQPPAVSGALSPTVYYLTPQLGLIVTLSSGASLTYTVQVSADNPNTFTNWNSHDTLVSQTASANGNIAFPVTGVRLNITSYTSGTATLSVAQWN